MKKLQLRVRIEAADTIPEHHLWCLQQAFAEKKKAFEPCNLIHVGINTNITNMSKLEKAAIRKALDSIYVTERVSAEESTDANLTRRFVAHDIEHLAQIFGKLYATIADDVDCREVELEFLCNDAALDGTFPQGLVRRDSSLSQAFANHKKRLSRSGSSMSSVTSPRSESRGSNLSPDHRLSSLSLSGTLSPDTPRYPRPTPTPKQ